MELLGCFDEYSWSILAETGEEAIISGKTSDGKDITLLNTFRSIRIKGGADFPIVRYTCDFLVIGTHVKGLDDKRNYWATARIPELTLWCQPKALNTTMFFGKNKTIERINVSFSTKFRSRKDVISRINVSDNTAIIIKKGVRYNGDHLAPEIEQYSYLEIRKKDKASIKEILADIFMFEQFLSFAMLSVVKCSKITLFDKNKYQQIENTRFYREIHIIHAFTERNNLQSPSLKAFRHLFDYNAIKDVYPAILKKWYNEPIELAPIRSHLISSLEKKQSYSSVDFLIIIQALEGFCRRFRCSRYRKENGLPERDYSDLIAMMGSLLSEFGDIELITKCEIDKDAVVDSRNYYSHFMPKQRDKKVFDGIELYELTIRLRILLICCTLNLFGFTNERINEILNESGSKVLEL